MKGLINLSEGVLIGIHGVILIARRKDIPTSSRFIADATGASPNTVSKTMQRLVQDGFIRSERGPAGGFTLARPAARISLLDILVAIDGKPDDRACLFDAGSCAMGTCIFGNTFRKLTAELRQFLAGRKIDSYLS